MSFVRTDPLRPPFHFDPIVGQKAAIYHTAGALGKGERVWILAKLPDSIRVVGDDITDKYLLLTNSHDGKSSLQVRFTPVRVVCQNTLTLALNQGGTDNGGIKLAHHTDIHRRLEDAERMLGIVRDRYNTLAETFREMVRVPMNKERLDQYLSQVFPCSAEAKTDTDTIPPFHRDRAWAEYFFDQGAGNSMAGVKGTLWAAYNGVTEWLDHRKTRQNATQRLTSIWFGGTNRIKARALAAAAELLPNWRN